MNKEELEEKIAIVTKMLQKRELEIHVLQERLKGYEIEYVKILKSDFEGVLEYGQDA